MDDPATSLSPPYEPSDIFSLSDQVLSDRLHFIEEIGFGNWGSVWLCKPKPGMSPPSDGFLPANKIAVKLVHRSKTSTTAARVRSLWNEMKIVRSFKSDPHPSIIPFHSFIITPSYALIIMTYLPTLIPVEVEEMKAREWFRFLLSGVEFLHKRGVVHNDIKPANILVSHKNIPVLVDFGFAEKYDLDSDTAFHSNLSYGTPEYLSPERARGLPHDTRKSDVWSLGVTFFEILIGRTPFENSDGEQFTSKEDLEKYWERTLRGKWVGEWKMSKGMEKLIKRMVAPNADLRCTATQALHDSLWHAKKESSPSHRRSSSYTSSIVFEKDMAKLMNIATPSSRSGKENNPQSPPGLDHSNIFEDETSIPRPTLSKSKSQPKVAATKIQPRKRVPVPPIVDLSPIKASPPSSPLSSAAMKENIASFNALADATNNRNAARRALGDIQSRSNLPRPRLATKTSVDGVGKEKRKGKALGDITSKHRKDENVDTSVISPKGKGSSNVKDRVKDWERERQRLREIEKLEELERERDEEVEKKREADAKKTHQEKEEELEERSSHKENAYKSSVPILPPPSLSPPLSQVFRAIPIDDTPSRIPSQSNKSSFKHNIRRSIDKTMQIYKSSATAIGQVTARSARSLSIDIKNEATSPKSASRRESWEEEMMFQDVSSTLPVVRTAAQNEQAAADARNDRLTIWMRNVEKVVEDARQNFASSASIPNTPLPSLPVPPLSRHISNSRSNRSSRLPRKVLAASQIFTEENVKALGDLSMVSNSTAGYATANNTTTVNDLSDVRSEGRSQLLVPGPRTPSRRRATVSTGSPQQDPEVFESGSPSKRKEKSKSQGNFFQQRIARLSLIEAELNKVPEPVPSPRLSDVLDRNLFIASSPASRECLDDSQSIVMPRDSSFDDLNSSPLHVEPYPARKPNPNAPLPDTPSQRRLEGVYDRFLMATSGVKRLGKGYQSDNVGPVCSSSSTSLGISSNQNNNKRAFYTARRPMPPPVSSEDSQRQTVSVDELGVMTCSAGAENSAALKDESNTTVALVRRAFKAMVPKATASRRVTRMA